MPFLFVLNFLGVFLLAWSAPADAEPPFLLRDYPTVLLAPKGQLEISADYLVMDSAVDIFDFREEESKSVDPSLRTPSLGDLNGGRLLVNYGLFSSTTLHGEYVYRDVDLSFSDFQVHSLEFSLRQGILGHPSGRGPRVTLDAGARLDFGEDIDFDSIDRINSIVRRIDPELSVSDIGSHLVFSHGDEQLFVSKAGRDPLGIAVEDMRDHTLFIRLTAGAPFGPLFPNLFAEVGRSEIDTRVTGNVDQYVPEGFGAAVDDLPLRLDRNENYWKVGGDLLVALPFDLQANLAYYYQRMDRDASLDFVDYNHVVQGNLTWFLNDRVAVDLGGTYYRRQFNGVIPFLYNEFTQTGFDHDYGVVHLGLSGVFGGL
jgi:hypothetical protein